jgi:hypothetical protein
MIMRTVVHVLLALACLPVGCGKDEGNSKPVPMLPEKRPDAPPPEGLIDTGPPPRAVGLGQPDFLAEGAERGAYDLAIAGKVAEAEKLGAAGTPGLLFAAARAGTGSRLHLTILEALARVGDERAIPEMQTPFRWESTKHEKVHTATVTALWNRLAARAPGGERPKVAVRWLGIRGWRPKRLDIERELAKVLADTAIDIVPADAAAIDGVLLAEYQEREGSRWDLGLDQGTGTGFHLKIDVIGFRKRAVTPIEVDGAPQQGFRLTERTTSSANDELYRLGLADFRESLAAAGVLINAGLR